MPRFTWLLAVTAAVCGPAGYYAAEATSAGAERISVHATRFDFGPKEIRVSRGRPVTIALSSPDFVHGFAIPDFNVRVDGIPARTVEITFTPDKAGRFVFLCDNFCGEGHDRMTGFLIVTEE